MNAFSFGSYYPGESPLHRLDPRAKLLLGCAFIVVALCARNVAALGAVAVFVAAFYLASRIPLGYAARSLAPKSPANTPQAPGISGPAPCK